ncbi:MAG: hypothetical protein ABI477_14725 [Chryseolinea sp.]
MIEQLKSAALQQFIRSHENVDAADILFKYRDIEGVPAGVVVNQIAGRKKAGEKIPLYYNTPGILYPPLKNLEQSSSERTAVFKAQLLSELSINGSCLDLSGGLGIDSYFLSTVSKDITMVEPDVDLLAMAAYNHKLLGATNIRHVNKKAADFLSSFTDKFGLIYIDPSRRIEGNKKVYSLKDSEPNIVTLHEEILQRSGYLLIKASPLLDIQRAISELSFVSKVFVLSVDNECKELLFLLTPQQKSDPDIIAVNLKKNGASRLQFTFSEEKSAHVQLGLPKKYLYEPNASILKAGAFKTVGKMYNIDKLHPNTHLYSSEVMVPEFQGKVFRIIAYVKADSKVLKEYFPDGKANITVRNYPLDPSALKKKTRLTDGGDRFLIGFTGVDKKYLVVAQRAN